jgi:predicted ATPase
VLYGQWVYQLLKGRLSQAQALAAEMLQQGEHSADEAIIATGHRLSGAVCMYLGELLAARAHLEQALARFDPAQRRLYASFYVQDPLVTLLMYLSANLLRLGYFDQARFRSKAAIEEARNLRHPHSLAVALLGPCWFAQATRSREELLARAEKLIAVADEHGIPWHHAVGTVLRGWALAEGGQPVEGVALLRAGMAAFRATGAVTEMPFFLTLLAEAEGKAMQWDEALGHLAEAEQLMAETEERWAEAELYRVRGNLLLAGHDRTAAEHCFRKSIDVAQRQSAKLWELRAAISLARFWRDQGKRDEARDLLTPIYRWFTEGFDTPVLNEAGVLLDEL